MLESTRPDYSLAIALLDAVKSSAEEVGAKLLLLEIPKRVSRTEFIASMPDEIRQRFDYVSPIHVFRRQAENVLYWEKSHGHFTPLGCKLVGERLSDRIIGQLNPDQLQLGKPGR
jgi:hypothetical protein